MSAVVLAALLALGATACGVLPEPDFERMIDQRSYRSYEPAPKSMFADGRAMRPPPEGTISRDRVLGRPAFTAGVVDARYVAAPPVTVDRARLERGRDRFDLFCAACHGLRGDGVSTVARRMALRKPPSLIAAPATTFPAGRTFQVISEGYGLMPSYASEMSVDDRWNVVAYLRALTLSQSVPLARLPSDLRARAEKELR